MRVLAIDTAGPVIGVALAVGDRVWTRVERVQRGAEGRLVPWARTLCEEAGIALDGVQGVAVAEGPGAFTGVRVGLATAVGLAMGLDVPLWGTSSLDGRAGRVEAGALPVLAMLDARKGRVYAAVYRDGVQVRPAGDVDPEVALSWVERPFLATGEGAQVYRAQVEARGGRLAEAADHPGVDQLARMGQQALARGEGRDPVTVRPVYLRAPDARPRPSRQQAGARPTQPGLGGTTDG